MSYERSTEWGLSNATVGDLVEIVSRRGDERTITEVVATTPRKVTMKNGMVFSRAGREWGYSTDYYYGTHAYKVLNLVMLLKEHALIKAELRLKRTRNEVRTMLDTYYTSMTQLEIDTVISVLENVKHRVENKPSPTSTD